MEGYDPDRHHRRSIRLKGYDYSRSGAYFVTIVVRNRRCLFGDVDGNDMRLNEAGDMVAAVWNSMTLRFADIDLDGFVVMPNHIHGIIVLTHGETPSVGAPLVGAHGIVNAHGIVGAPIPDRDTGEIGAIGANVGIGAPRGAPTIGDIVGAYKSLTTVHYTRGVTNDGWRPFAGLLWQRNYYEHIIRDDAALNRIRQYIMENPARWAEDTENPGWQPHNREGS